MTNKNRILFIGNSDDVKEIFEGFLDDSYEITFMKHEDAINTQKNMIGLTDIILLDIGNDDEFKFLEVLKEKGHNTIIPVIVITPIKSAQVEMTAFKLGAADFIVRPFKNDIAKVRIDNQLEMRSNRESMQYLTDCVVNKGQSIWDSVLHLMAEVIEGRSFTLNDHVKKTYMVSMMLLTEMRASGMYKELVDERNILSIIKVTALHDIGKIGVSDTILLKQDKLTYDEFEDIKRHTIIGDRIAKSLLGNVDDTYVKYFRQICRSHHERWDGTGYPDGLQGEEIPLSARVVGLVDVFDTLVGERVYKKAHSFEEAFGIVKNESGRCFDPNVVELFMKIKPEILKLYGIDYL